jgi:hypothetical protein
MEMERCPFCEVKDRADRPAVVADALAARVVELENALERIKYLSGGGEPAPMFYKIYREANQWLYKEGQNDLPSERRGCSAERRPMAGE